MRASKGESLTVSLSFWTPSSTATDVEKIWRKQQQTKTKQHETKTNHTQREPLFFFLNEWLTRRNYTRALKMLNLRVSNLTRPTCIPFLVPWNRRGNMSDTRNMVLLSVAVISRTSGFLMVYIWTLCLTRPLFGRRLKIGIKQIKQHWERNRLLKTVETQLNENSTETEIDENFVVAKVQHEEPL